MLSGSDERVKVNGILVSIAGITMEKISHEKFVPSHEKLAFATVQQLHLLLAKILQL